MKKLFSLFIISIVLFSCARLGNPNGGTKDSIAPKFLNSNIDTTRINVSRNIKELRLDFDEYVMLKDINKNLLISPPIKKITKIIPSNLANKYVLIKWEDTLKANTTYSFNFGNAIVDNNEGNALPYFNFAFSTGEKLDDLFISGTVKDAMVYTKENQTPKEHKIVVGLYNADEKTDFKQKPNYITKADEENYFELNYLPKGNYNIVGFEDENQNSIYDSGKEKVAFLKEKISIDSTSLKGLKLKLFPSKKAVKFKEYKNVNGGILFLFEGNPETVEVKSISEELKEYKVTHSVRSDSVNIWFNAANNNLNTINTPLKLSYFTAAKNDTIPVSYKAVKEDFTISSNAGNILAPEQDFSIISTFPVDKIKTDTWKLESDSIAQNFTARISEKNPFKIMIKSDFKPGKKYALTIPKETVSSYYTSISKSYQFQFEADKPENYGAFTAILKNKPTAKFWFELIDEKGDIIYSKFTNESEIKFINLKPGVYSARIRVDNNENGYWDESDLSENILAEDVFILNKEINVRPLWEIREEWSLE